jgi:hypothetical protein
MAVKINVANQITCGLRYCLYQKKLKLTREKMHTVVTFGAQFALAVSIKLAHVSLLSQIMMKILENLMWGSEVI